MSETVRYGATLAVRCSDVLPPLVRRAAVRRGVKEAQWLRDALAASLRADGFDPSEPRTQYALVASGELVKSHQGTPIITYEPELDERGEWIAIENVHSQEFRADLHWRMHPHPLRVEGARVIREYPVVRKTELGE